ncbi:MAG: CHAD domain-containing protein [Deferribacterota bacterium]|nr:CHAD domain-containing protein [Deferribacterota bacterium]
MSSLNNLYTLELENKNENSYEIFDTFEYSLYFKNIILYKKNEEYILFYTKKNNTITFANTPFKFWWDVDDAEVRGILKDILGPRALISLKKFKGIEEIYNIYDANKKIFSKLSIYEISDFNIQVLYVHRIKGYKKETKEINKKLKEILNLDNIKARNLPEHLFSALNLKITRYSNKIDIQVERDEKAYLAISKILKKLLSIIRINLFGISNQIDSEFLHDFRVSLRRTRTALNQLKEIFKDEEIAIFKDEFAGVMKKTNYLRDLDVQFLTLIELKYELSGDLNDGLTLILDYLGSKINKEYNKLGRFLQTKKFNTLLEKWSKFLDDPSGSVQEYGYKPIGEIASFYISKALKKVDRRYRIAVIDFNPVNMHKLRIACKKLRYVLEFFNPIYREDIYSDAISALKKLQDSLGLYQDVQVQSNMIYEILKDLGQPEGKSSVYLVAGYIIRLLDEKKKESSTNFLDHYDNFYTLIDSKKFKKVINY